MVRIQNAPNGWRTGREMAKKRADFFSQNTQKAAGFADYLMREKSALIITGNELFPETPSKDSENLQKIKKIIGKLVLYFVKPISTVSMTLLNPFIPPNPIKTRTLYWSR